MSNTMDMTAEGNGNEIGIANVPDTVAVIVEDESSTPPTTKSGDSSETGIDEIECYPRHYDCRNNPTVSESYNKLEQEMISIFQKELQTSQKSVDQQKILIQQQTSTTQEQYENKLATVKLLTKQMNYHHHLQEQKYMHEIQSLRELLNHSESVWQSRIDNMDHQLQKQQTHQYQMIAEMKQEIEQYRAQNDVFAKESQQSTINFETARTELNDMIQNNKVIVQNLEAKVMEQSQDVVAFRSDATAEKEEMELMVQSWMTQCETLQQQVRELQKESISTNERVQNTATMQDSIQQSIHKMGQTYETVLENVMEQIQEQSELQMTQYNQIQTTQKEICDNVEHIQHTTTEQFQQVNVQVTKQEDTIKVIQARQDTFNTSVTTMEQRLDGIDSEISKEKDVVNEQIDKHTKLCDEVTELQGIVSKLADDSNTRFNTMEKSVDSEVQSMKEMKETMLSAIENSISRVKSVDNKIVIHSIQMGEMAKDIKEMTTTMSGIENRHQQMFDSVHAQCQTMSKQIQENLNDQTKINGSVEESILQAQSSMKDVTTRTTILEKMTDTMSNRIDQLDMDHTTTRGNFMVQHKSIESNLTDQMKHLVHQIQNVQTSTQENVKNIATSIEKMVKDHGVKLGEHDATLSKLSALTHSTIITVKDHTNKHQSHESTIVSIQKDIDSIHKRLQSVDENQSSKLKDHIASTKSQLDNIVNVTLPNQLESYNKIRVRIVESESRMKELNEQSYKAIYDRVNLLQDNMKSMNVVMDTLRKTQDDATIDRVSMKQTVEKIINDMSALNEAFSLEVAHISELKSKISDVESSIEVRANETRALESAFETHLSKTEEQHEQHINDLNKSLTQIMTLVQLKEVMMKQINDCVSHLSTLDTASAEYKAELTEISKQISEHDATFENVVKDNTTRNHDVDEMLERHKVALDALTYDVKKQFEVQKGVNEFVSQSIATAAVSTTDLEKRADLLSSRLDEIVDSFNEHVKAFNVNETDTKASIKIYDEKILLLESKVVDAEASMRNHHETTVRDMSSNFESQIQSSLNDVKTKLDRHADRLKTAKEARIVIRNDLKQLVEIINEQFGQIRTEIGESKATMASNLDTIVQTRDDIMSKMNDTETESKLEYVAGKIKSIDEKLKAFKETVFTLQAELEQWKNKSEKDLTGHVETIRSKLETLDGEYKSIIDTTKSTQESISIMQKEIKSVKKDHQIVEKTIDLVEEISTKIDYLAGKFKSLSDNLKSTNAAVTSLQGKMNQQGEAAEQADIQNKSDARSTSESLDSLYQAFKDLKQEFEEIKAHTVDSKQASIEEKGVLQGKIDVLKSQIDSILQQLQTIESDKISKTNVEQMREDLERLSNQIDQNNKDIINTETTYRNLSDEVNGLKNRQTMYKKTILKRHGQKEQVGNELVPTSPVKKLLVTDAVNKVATTEDDEEEYHEARDVEDNLPLSTQLVDQREQE